MFNSEWYDQNHEFWLVEKERAECALWQLRSWTKDDIRTERLWVCNFSSRPSCWCQDVQDSCNELLFRMSWNFLCLSLVKDSGIWTMSRRPSRKRSPWTYWKKSGICMSHQELKWKRRIWKCRKTRRIVRKVRASFEISNLYLRHRLQGFCREEGLELDDSIECLVFFLRRTSLRRLRGKRSLEGGLWKRRIQCATHQLSRSMKKLNFDSSSNPVTRRII